MRNKKNLHNLDTLEKEILTHQLYVKELEHKLEKNTGHLRDNLPSYLSGSLACKQGKEYEKKKFLGAVLDNEYVHSFFSTLTTTAADKTGELLERLINKVIKKTD